MRRTITIGDHKTTYRKHKFDGIIYSIINHFGMSTDGKYVITIKDGTQFSFKRISSTITKIFFFGDNVNDVKDIGGFCTRAFEIIFGFKPEDKRYDITVKKLKDKPA